MVPTCRRTSPTRRRLWLKMWRDRTGDQLDGVLTADPVTLSYLLKATGPIKLDDGRVFNADNVVDFTENGIYLLYPHSDHRRNVYQQEIASKAMDALLSGDASPQSLVDALGQAASERRLLVYSDASERAARTARHLGQWCDPEWSGTACGRRRDQWWGEQTRLLPARQDGLPGE